MSDALRVALVGNQTAVKPLYLTTSLEHAKKLPTMRV